MLLAGYAVKSLSGAHLSLAFNAARKYRRKKDRSERTRNSHCLSESVSYSLGSSDRFAADVIARLRCVWKGNKREVSHVLLVSESQASWIKLPTESTSICFPQRQRVARWFPDGFANITGDPGAGSHLKTS